MLMVHHINRSAIVFIDGANLHMSMQLVGKQIDFLRFKHWLDSLYAHYSINYYTALKLDADGYNNLRSLIDWLKFNGIRVIDKEARTMLRDGKEFIKGNMDIEIAVDALVALQGNFDDFIFFTGDGDFAYLLKEVRRAGKKITVVSSLAMPEPHLGYVQNATVVSELLRRETDEFVNLNRRGDVSEGWFKQSKFDQR